MICPFCNMNSSSANLECFSNIKDHIVHCTLIGTTYATVIIIGKTYYYLYNDGTLKKDFPNRKGEKFDSFDLAIDYLKRLYDLYVFSL